MKTLYIDGDGCNKKMRELCERLASRGIKVIIVANKKITCSNNASIMQECSTDSQAADMYILDNASAGDLVISRDLYLAKQLFEKHNNAIFVCSDNGEEYFLQSIESRIARSEHAKRRREDTTLLQNNTMHNTMLANAKEEKKKFEKIANYLESWRSNNVTR